MQQVVDLKHKYIAARNNFGAWTSLYCSKALLLTLVYNLLKFISNIIPLFASPQDLATMSAFTRDPSLVWEFYHYRREVMLSKFPNKVQ